jgi:hypothetical protein
MTVPLAPGELLYTTDTKQFYIGDGSIIGGIATSGFNSNNAKDAAAAMITSGSHTGISFEYDNEAKILSALVSIESISGPIVADALRGSVFADDSSLLVDAIDKRFFGNLTGSVFANDASSIINSADKTLLINVIDSGNELVEIQTKFLFNSEDAESITLEKVSNDTISDSILFKKSRGTSETLQAITSGDVLSSIDTFGYDGEDYTLSSRIAVTVDGAVSLSTVPTKLGFYIQNRVGDFKNPLEISSNPFDGRASIKILRDRGSVNNPQKVEPGDITHELLFQSYDGEKYLTHGGITLDVFNTTDVNKIDSAMSFQILDEEGNIRIPLQIEYTGTVNVYKDIYDGSLIKFYQSHETPDACNLEFWRARGTSANPTQILQNDDIVDFAWLAYHNGEYRVSAGLKAKAVELIGDSVVTRFGLAMDNGSSFTERFVLESSGVMTFNQAPIVAGSNPGEVDTSAPVNYMRVKVNGVEYAMPLFTINPTP